MNKNIILGIVAAGIVALYVTGVFDEEFVYPIDEPNFTGTWKEVIEIHYEDGTSEFIGNTGKEATLYYNTAPFDKFFVHLYIEPTSAGSANEIEIDLLDLHMMYSVSSTAIVSAESAISQQSSGYRPFAVNGGFQEVGVSILPLDALEGIIIPYDNDYTLKIWYEGFVSYRIPIIGSTIYTTPAPTGVIELQFSSIDTASIINFNWDIDPIAN